MSTKNKTNVTAINIQFEYFCKYERSQFMVNMYKWQSRQVLFAFINYKSYYKENKHMNIQPNYILHILYSKYTSTSTADSVYITNVYSIYCFHDNNQVIRYAIVITKLCKIYCANTHTNNNLTKYLYINIGLYSKNSCQ